MPEQPANEVSPLRLYLDRHIMTRLAEDLARRGYDCLTTQQAGNDRATDEEQLTFATAQRRVIVTYNIRDFAPLHQNWLAIGRQHAGIIVSRQLAGRQYGVLLNRVLRLLAELTAEDLRDNFVHLERFKE
jgi:predicted nuclease of predicted toxin-antitoxin system